MTIIDAYYNLNIRKGYKTNLLAHGLSVTQTDRTYTRFGTYLSRLKSVGYHTRLSQMTTEDTFLEALHEIFDVKWANHIEYTEIPYHFYAYPDYLRAAVTWDPTLKIDGLNPAEPPATNMSLFDEAAFITRYEEPYIKDGKLLIIANPNVIKVVVKSMLGGGGIEEAVEYLSYYYGAVLPKMERPDYRALLAERRPKKKFTKEKGTLRLIEITDKDGNREVLGGVEAIEKVVATVGEQALMKSTITLEREKVVIRFHKPPTTLQYKLLPSGNYLNIKGNTTDKYKVLLVLNATFRLGWNIRLVNTHG